ncbi:MBL fold metallo-hydrolase [Desulfotruncus alcoholivorax]|uniref:MBL fold metallo-hydrolase n=1 Tax=Desulfotruncus alcoholivorax TaxID=265477 RepID=UPI00042A31E5|nr:MBL fold metallo-hydrolase [Desulfotruncus alcoholivorax]
MDFKSIKIINGPNASRFPSCTTLLVDGGDTVAVIDPGAGPEAFAVVEDKYIIDIIINTHYHFDHINGNYLFPNARVLMNPVEAGFFSEIRNVAKWLGIAEIFGDSGVEDWIKKVSDPKTRLTGYSPCYRHEWWLSTRREAQSYQYDREWQIGRVRVIMIHSPGHTRGFCCPYFPDEGLVYTGDIDLTGFGPWYFGSDGDIEEFVASARRVAQLDARWFLTGHQEGLLSRKEFKERLEQYLDIINQRQERLESMLREGIRPEEISGHGFVYAAKYQVDPWIAMWDKIAVRKHLNVLGMDVPDQ